MGKIDKIEKYVKSGKVKKVITLALNDDKEVRLAAIAGLGKLVESEDAMNALINMMDDIDVDIREAAVTALGESRDSYVETQLSYCISHDKEAKVIDAAKKSLEKIRASK